MKEQAYNITKTKYSRTQRQSNLNKSMEARFKISPQKFEDHTLGEIVSLKYFCGHGSSESAGSLASRKIFQTKVHLVPGYDTLVYPTVEENGQTRPNKYSELTEVQQLQDDWDVQATNIILHGLPPDVYSLVNHQEEAKDIWNRFLDALPLEWNKFVTDVKLAKSLYTNNYDQLYAYLSQHERHANEVRINREIYSDSIAFQGEDLIKCINKAMAFLFAVASRFPPSNNQLRTSSNPRNQVTIQDDPGMSEALVANHTIPQNSAFQTDDLDAYDSDCDDLSLAKAVLMANLSRCDPEVLFEVPYSEYYPNVMINQDAQEMQYSEQTHVDDFKDNKIHSGSNIILYSQYLQETQDARY
ncbi:hypothetical protein Tco_0741505 [Tanacetum coccineum]